MQDKIFMAINNATNEMAGDLKIQLLEELINFIEEKRSTNRPPKFSEDMLRFLKEKNLLEDLYKEVGY